MNVIAITEEFSNHRPKIHDKENDESAQCLDLLFSPTFNFSLSAGDAPVSLFATGSVLIVSTFASCLDGSE